MLSEDQKNIVRTIMNAADPQNVLDWGYTNETSSHDSYYISYNEKHVGFFRFVDPITLYVKAGRHFRTFDIANPAEFDVNNVALWIIRSVLYDFAININDNITDAPLDWKIKLIESLKSVLIWAMIIGGILIGISLFL